jgi:DNA-binding transcriptional MocR family regulator
MNVLHWREAVLAETRIGNTTRAVAMLISSRLRNGAAYLRVREIAQEIGKSPGSVFHSIQTLQKLGYLTVTRGPDILSPNTYEPRFPDENATLQGKTTIVEKQSQQTAVKGQP